MAAAKVKRSKPAGAKATARGANLVDRVGAIPDDAWLLARVPGKLAASARAAALLALGYPHAIVTTDESLGEFADGIAFAEHYGGAIIPRAALPILLAHALANTDEQKRAAIAKPAKLVLAKALDWVLRYKKGRDVWLLEAIAGSVPLAEAMVAALAKLPIKDWNGGKLDRSGSTVVRALGFVLWRVPPEVRERLRAVLGGKLDELSAKGTLSPSGQALDVILGGRAGVERSGSRGNDELHLGDLVHAGDDPQWVADRVTARLKTLKPADRETFSIQYAVVGGPKVLAPLRAAVDRFLKEQRPTINEQLSLCVNT